MGIYLRNITGVEPFDVLSCWGDAEYCGDPRFKIFNWPEECTWFDMPGVILLFALYLYYVLPAFATSDGGPPKSSWLLRSNSWGFWWMLFIMEMIHHGNAVFMAKTELRTPGSSPFGRMFIISLMVCAILPWSYLRGAHSALLLVMDCPPVHVLFLSVFSFGVC